MPPLLTSRNDSIGTGNPKDYKPRKLTEKELRDKIWRELDSDTIFHQPNEYEPDIENDNIKRIKSFIQECKTKDEPVVMHIGEITISVDKKKPEKITFSSLGNLGSFVTNVHQRYPYRITINGDDMYSEVDIIDSSDYAIRATYKEKGLHDVHIPVRVPQRVTIIDGEEINESFYVYSREKGTESSHIISKLLEVNPEYHVGNENELYRENVNPEEQIKTLVSSVSELKQHLSPNSSTYLGDDIQTGLYETPLDYDKNKYNTHYAKNVMPLNSYGEGIAIAKDIEKHCQYIYSLIMQAYKGVYEKAETQENVGGIGNIPESKEIESSEVVFQQPIGDKPSENDGESIYNGVNVEELDDEQLETFIGQMNNQQKENEKKIERLQKLKRAKDLIALNKKQDRIISELESQIQDRGVDIGE